MENEKNAWAHLPNASLIDTLLERCAARDAALIAARYAARDAALIAARYAARDAAHDAAYIAARDAARYAAYIAARDAAHGAARYAAYIAARDAAHDAAYCAAALVAWDDMPAYLTMSNAALGALRKIADGTNTAHKALAAQIYKEFCRGK